MLTDRIYCDLYDKVLQVEDKCAGCPFRLASEDQSTLGHIHAAIKAKKAQTGQPPPCAVRSVRA